MKTEFEFTPEYDDSLPLKTVVYQALGAASVAWTEDGVFDDSFATMIGEKLIDHINRNFVPRASA